MAAIAPERKEQARAWCEILGPRAAARKVGIPEGTVTRWCCQESWPKPDFILPVKDYAFGGLAAIQRQARVEVHDARDEILKEHSKETKIYLSASALKASHDASLATGAELRSKTGSIGLLNVARTADSVHGWTAERAVPAQVQVAVINAPSEAERAAMRETDAKLDAIAARLAAYEPPKV